MGTVYLFKVTAWKAKIINVVGIFTNTKWNFLFLFQLSSIKLTGRQMCYTSKTLQHIMWTISPTWSAYVQEENFHSALERWWCLPSICLDLGTMIQCLLIWNNCLRKSWISPSLNRTHTLPHLNQYKYMAHSIWLSPMHQRQPWEAETRLKTDLHQKVKENKTACLFAHPLGQIFCFLFFFFFLSSGLYSPLFSIDFRNILVSLY